MAEEVLTEIFDNCVRWRVAFDIFFHARDELRGITPTIEEHLKAIEDELDKKCCEELPRIMPNYYGGGEDANEKAERIIREIYEEG